MNNQDRIRARIARSKARREAKRLERAEQYGRMDKVMTNQHLFKSLMKRRKGTDWKQSVMDYVFHAIVRNKRQKDAILAGAHPEPGMIREIFLYERGKRRRVHAVAIDSRVVQGVICDNCITPLTQPGLIMDNPASTAGKGVSWTRYRVLRHIRKGLIRTGFPSWALVYDLKGFFDSIPHVLCERILRAVHMDDMLVSLSMHFIKMYQVFEAREIGRKRSEEEMRKILEKLDRNEGVGVSLGSQISQDMALAAPNALDHTVKDMLGVKEYIRYMDDGYIQGEKNELAAIRTRIAQVCKDMGLRLHETKTHIVKLSRGFPYLKIRYTVLETGRIIKRMARAGIVRMRQKLKKLRGLVNQGRATLDDVFNTTKSWLGNAEKYSHSYRSRKAVLSLYHKLFRSYRMEGVIA